MAETEMTFLKFLQGLVVEAQVQLGILPHPATGERTMNLPYARATVRILELLRDKSDGNRSDEEERYLSGALQGLRGRLKQAEDQAEVMR